MTRSDRILVIDDNSAIHEDLRKAIFWDESPSEARDLKALLLGEPPEPREESAPAKALELECANQGKEGLRMVQKAISDQRPYALAFVDMRMPPGWDGLETIERLWEVDPDLQIVLCTAFSDHTWQDINARLGPEDRLLILKKPFDVIEARQLAYALTAKWNHARRAEERRIALESTNAQLEAEVTAHRQTESLLVHGSLHDTLTGLPNRSLLSERIQHVLHQAKRSSEYNFAVLFLDLDDFKLVNDSLGHHIGDRLLVEISARIQGCLRSSDCTSRNLGNTAARLGGDEFVVLLEGLTEEEDAEHIAQRILEEIAVPVEVDGYQLRPSASLGILHSSARYGEPGELLRDADTALYRAKEIGKGCYAVFDDAMRHETIARLRVDSDLRQGIERDELFLQYQPIVDLSSGATIGLEALVRWQHPKHGVIAPLDFVPIAEETGMILLLGEWVLHGACAQIAEWRRRGVCEGLFVNVNISSKQMNSLDFVDQVLKILAEYHLDREDLNLELTESFLMRTFGHGPLVLQQLVEQEIRLHVDDFGTGFSSLTYLDRLPISALKLDRLFIAELTSNSSSQATVRAIIQMAHARKLKLIAEGIESPEQLAVLQQLGCDLGQGFYFSRAVDAGLVEELVKRPTLMPRRAG